MKFCRMTTSRIVAHELQRECFGNYNSECGRKMEVMRVSRWNPAKARSGLYVRVDAHYNLRLQAIPHSVSSLDSVACVMLQ